RQLGRGTPAESGKSCPVESLDKGGLPGVHLAKSLQTPREGGLGAGPTGDLTQVEQELDCLLVFLRLLERDGPLHLRPDVLLPGGELIEVPRAGGGLLPGLALRLPGGLLAPASLLGLRLFAS